MREWSTSRQSIENDMYTQLVFMWICWLSNVVTGLKLLCYLLPFLFLFFVITNFVKLTSIRSYISFHRCLFVRLFFCVFLFYFWPEGYWKAGSSCNGFYWKAFYSSWANMLKINLSLFSISSRMGMRCFYMNWSMLRNMPRLVAF